MITSLRRRLIVIAIILCVISFPVLLFVFGASLALLLSPIVRWITAVILVIDIVALLFSTSDKYRLRSGLVIYASSYIYGISLWTYGLATTLSLWGWLAAIIGILFAGVGVVPIGILAALFSAKWYTLISLLVMLGFTYASKDIGKAIVYKAKDTQDKNNSSIKNENNIVEGEVIDVE